MVLKPRARSATRPRDRVIDIRPVGKRIRVAMWKAWYSPLLLIPLGSARSDIEADVSVWTAALHSYPRATDRWARLSLLATRPAFRSLHAWRLGRASPVLAALAYFAGLLYPGERTLRFHCGDIGPGLFIQHGVATIISARRIGDYCWISQQVTIGYTGAGKRPTIGNGVAIYAGAKVLGDVNVGDGVTVGANAVVLRDVPPYHTAVGVPARLLPPKPERAARHRESESAQPDATPTPRNVSRQPT